MGGVDGRQGPGQGRRPRQGRRREDRQDRRRGRVLRRATSSAWRSRACAVNRVLVDPGDPAGGGVLLLLPARPLQPLAPVHRERRGRRGDRGGRQDQPRRRQADPRSTPCDGVDAGEGRARSSTRPSSPPRCATRPSRWSRRSGRSSSRRTPPWSRSTRWPASRATSSRRSTARSRSTTTPPRSATPTTTQFEIREEADPLEAKAKDKGLNYVKLDGQVGIIGNGAGLVMSTLDVVAYAGEAHGGVKPANFLDIGGGANAQVMADGLDVILNDAQVKSVFVNVFGGITACDEVANGIKGALEILGDEESKPLVVRLDGNNVEEGRRDPRRAQPPAGHPGRHDGRRGRQGRRARPPGLRERTEQMSIYLNKDSQDHRPGHDRRDGCQAHHPHGRVRRQHRRRRQRPQGRHHRRARRQGAAGLRHRRGGDEGDRRRRVRRLRAAGLHQGRLHRGHRRRDPAARGHHRGRAGPRHRRGRGRTSRASPPG